MRPSVAFEQMREAIRAAATRYRTANLRVFGSVLHGTDREGSDLDLLVDALPGASLLDICGLEDELGDVLGVPVHVATAAELPEKFRGKVLAEALPV